MSYEPAYAEMCRQNDQLRTALRGMFDLVQSGELIRNTSRDEDADWMQRMLRMVATLKKAQECLDA